MGTAPGERLGHLSGGLQKLSGAQTTVDELSKEALHKNVILKEKQAAADEALQRITVSMSTASDRRVEVEKLSAVVHCLRRRLLLSPVVVGSRPDPRPPLTPPPVHSPHRRQYSRAVR